jgi:hypothetical protein
MEEFCANPQHKKKNCLEGPSAKGRIILKPIFESWIKYTAQAVLNTVIRSGVLINAYNFNHKLFEKFLHTEQQSSAQHRTQLSSVFCVQEVAGSSFGPGSCGFSQSLQATIGTVSDVRPRPFPPTPFHINSVLTNLQSALLSVVKKNMIKWTACNHLTRHVPLQVTTAATATSTAFMTAASATLLPDFTASLPRVLQIQLTSRAWS